MTFDRSKLTLELNHPAVKGQAAPAPLVYSVKEILSCHYCEDSCTVLMIQTSGEKIVELEFEEPSNAVDLPNELFDLNLNCHFVLDDGLVICE